jgi:hypothetical protein
MFSNHVDSDNVSEIFYLLNFFSKESSEQWCLVPDSFSPVWVETYEVQCNVYSPILFLVCMLMRSVEEMMEKSYFLNEGVMGILIDEIYPILAYWMIDAYGCRDFVFEKDSETTGSGKIWIVLRRLCKIALSLENWSEHEIQGLSFNYFVEKYSYPYDPV